MLEKERAEASLEEEGAKVAALRIALVRAGAEAREEPFFSDADLAYPAFVAAQTELYEQKKSLSLVELIWLAGGQSL